MTTSRIRRLSSVADDRFIATVGDAPYDREDTEANARLIAAAPEMLAALKAMLNPDETDRDVDMALAAIP
jgi:hypothetical protein